MVEGFEGHAEEVFAGAVGTPVIGHFKFGFVAAEARDGEEARDQIPGDRFAGRADEFAQECVLA